MSVYTNTLLLALSSFSLLLLPSPINLVFEIKTEPVTQAGIIVTVVAFSSGSLALIGTYSQSPSLSIFCAVVLAVIDYLSLRLAPR
jgi:hypothetical protein